KGIRTKLLRFLDLKCGKQAIAGWQRRSANNCRYQRGLRANKTSIDGFMIRSHQGPQLGDSRGFSRKGTSETSRPHGLMRQEREATTKRTTAGMVEIGPQLCRVSIS